MSDDNKKYHRTHRPAPSEPQQQKQPTEEQDKK